MLKRSDVLFLQIRIIGSGIDVVCAAEYDSPSPKIDEVGGLKCVDSGPKQPGG